MDISDLLNEFKQFPTDARVQMLSEVDQRRFAMVICLHVDGMKHVFSDEEVVFQLRISKDAYQKTKARLRSRGLINEGNTPSGWCLA